MVDRRTDTVAEGRETSPSMSEREVTVEWRGRVGWGAGAEAVEGSVEEEMEEVVERVGERVPGEEA